MTFTAASPYHPTETIINVRPIRRNDTWQCELCHERVSYPDAIYFLCSPDRSVDEAFALCETCVFKKFDAFDNHGGPLP